jgi:hypothetical protein
VDRARFLLYCVGAPARIIRASLLSLNYVTGSYGCTFRISVPVQLVAISQRSITSNVLNAYLGANRPNSANVRPSKALAAVWICPGFVEG